jgi:hypothetical protein
MKIDQNENTVLGSVEESSRKKKPTGFAVG